MHQEAAAPIGLAGLVHLVPQPVDVARIFANQQMFEALCRHRVHGGIDDGPRRQRVGMRLTDTDNAFIGVDANHTNRLATIANLLHDGQAQQNCLYISYFHCCPRLIRPIMLTRAPAANRPLDPSAS